MDFIFPLTEPAPKNRTVKAGAKNRMLEIWAVTARAWP